MQVLMMNIAEILIYVFIGLVFSVLGYKITTLMYKKSFDVSKEIDEHNRAVGIMIGGMFVAIAIIMSGVL